MDRKPRLDPTNPADLLKMATQPKTVVIDGNSATASDPAELIKLLSLSAIQAKRQRGSPLFSQFKLRPPGTVEPFRGY